jgi:hypothetical protein
MSIEDDEIEDRKLNSLARLTSIKVLYYHEYHKIMIVANDPHDKCRYFEVVSLLLK